MTAAIRTLPRLRFRKPRWPRGSRFALVMALIASVFLFVDIAFGGGAPYILIQTVIAVYWWRRYIRSRHTDNDDGPSGT